MRSFKVIDLFAGPGGLAEGFSRVVDIDGKRRFEIVLSVEKDPAAHRTLTLRAFTRQFAPDKLPKAYYDFAQGRISLEELRNTHTEEWDAAEAEAELIELGTPHGNRKVNARIRQLLDKADPQDEFVVIGGPPCQAYSLAGRARNRGVKGYVAEKDNRHYLYREYIKILERVRPAVFVMENVKGMLSSSVSGKDVFRRVRADLENAGGTESSYHLIALSPRSNGRRLCGEDLENSDFVIRSECHGVPQARHRVIIVGVRHDVFEKLPRESSLPRLGISATATVRAAISDLPKVRSAMSKGDTPDGWRQAVSEQMKIACGSEKPAGASVETWNTMSSAAAEFDGKTRLSDRTAKNGQTTFAGGNDLSEFLLDPKLGVISDHESRGHMASDFGRYFFAACFAAATGESPKTSDFPAILAPAHANWGTKKFTDRFRVQRWDHPATTVVSHISKDGHYYIHPDPVQCRSLTPREAARLQTFPDNYLFLGNRTERFHQIGNAVPPFLAWQIGKAVTELLDALNKGGDG